MDDNFIGMDISNTGPSYEDTQCPRDDCEGEFEGTDICPYGCTKYTGSEDG